jgi:hypothetical protein
MPIVTVAYKFHIEALEFGQGDLGVCIVKLEEKFAVGIWELGLQGIAGMPVEWARAQKSAPISVMSFPTLNQAISVWEALTGAKSTLTEDSIYKN